MPTENEPGMPTKETLTAWAACVANHIPSPAHPHLGCLWANQPQAEAIASFLRSESLQRALALAESFEWIETNHALVCYGSGPGAMVGIRVGGKDGLWVSGYPSIPEAVSALRAKLETKES